LRLSSIFQPRKRELHYPDIKNIDVALRTQFDALLAGIIPQEPYADTSIGFLADAKVDVRDLLTKGEGDFIGERRDGVLGLELAQAFYDRVLTLDIGPYRSREQSRSRIKSVLVNWVKNQRPSWNAEHIQHFVLRHQEVVSQAIAAGCVNCAFSEDAQAVVAARARRRINDAWEIPESELVSDITHELSVAGNVLEPGLIEKGRSGAEKRFEAWLASEVAAKRVGWWWKNGIRDEKYLGIEFDYNGQVERTYPDFLVMLSSGKLLVLEVKDVDDPDGAITETTNAKAVGLAVWASAQNSRRTTDKQLFDAPEVDAGVVVAYQEGGVMVVKMGDPSDWHEPSKLNLSSNNGWSVLNTVDKVGKGES
jgi:hypothetical protein